MKYAPTVRIALRYVIGPVFFGSATVGEYLAADPDLVMVGALVAGVIVESFYAIAKRKGWAT